MDATGEPAAGSSNAEASSSVAAASKGANAAGGNASETIAVVDIFQRLSGVRQGVCLWRSATTLRISSRLLGVSAKDQERRDANADQLRDSLVIGVCFCVT